MKKNYFHSFIAVGLMFFGLLGFSQNTLVNSEYGNVIQTYLTQNQAKFSFTANDIEDLYVNKEYFSKSTKINHVYVNQRFQGIEIYNAVSSVAIRDNAIFYYANNLISNITEKVNTTIPQINAQRAIENVVAQLDLGSIQGLELISGNDKEFLYSSGNISRTEIPVKLVYLFTEQGELKLSWDLSIHTLNGKNWWSLRVDAISGQIIDTTDWIVSCNFGDGNHSNHDSHSNSKEEFTLFKTNSFVADGSQYNVFALPVEAPSFGGRTLLSDPANDNASPYGWHDINGAAGAEYTITRGNNVYAYEDTNANDSPGLSPEGTATLNFDFPLDLNQNPIGYQDVSVTNMFYVSNMMHDIWYQYGFDEASGNFQENNYGNGGLGSDYVNAQGQDGGGLNNANFGTPPDGQNPQMQMFLWSEPPGNALTLNNGDLAGDYVAQPGNFGANIPSTPLTADLAITVDNVNDPNDACNPITNGSELDGKIVVIRRGDCEFGFKSKAAQDDGAVAVIIVNNVPGGTIAMGGGAVGGTVTIPVVMVDNIDGEAIITALLAGDTISATLLSSVSYQRDGGFDNGIIAHEFGHGISNRLTGGTSVNCLSNSEQMGEGWSDWFGLMLTMKPGDQPEDGRGIGTYAIGQTTTGLGIRLAPYSTDFAINDYTYDDTNDSANVAVPHGMGFIWATVIWDLTWAYVDKYGFDEDLYNGTGGNNMVMQVVIDGLKLQGCNPGFVAGRDGILAADMALTGGEDQCLIWEVFANRGVGLNASQGFGFSRNDQVEDFTTPPDNDPSLANCTSLSVEDFNSRSYKVYPNPTNGRLFVKTAKNYGEVTMTLTDINGRQVLAKKVELFNEVELDINRLQSGIYILNINGQSFSANHKIIKN